MANLKIKQVDGGVTFAARIVPSSSRTALCGLLDYMLKIKVSAPPEKGKANRCLVEFLAKQLGVKKKSVSIISGQSNPVKEIQVSDMSAERLLAKLDLNEVVRSS